MRENGYEMDDRDFDLAVHNGLSEPPPDDIVRGVTPWRQAMDDVLIGLALNAVTLNFWWLNYILPTAGLILMLLGFRRLRRENVWFKSCFVLTILRMALNGPMLALNATIFHGIFANGPLSGILTTTNIALLFAQFYCLWQGLRAVRRKAGLPAHAGAAAALMIWYLFICVLALLQYSGFLIGILLIVAYCFIIRNLFRLSRELDEAGYAVEPAAVRVPDRVLTAAILVCLAVGIGCGYLFGSRYPMQWAPVSSTEHAQVERIQSHLVSLGFPEAILQDLTVQDISDCEGALEVVTYSRDHAFNDGRSVTERRGDGVYHTRVYDVLELRLTGVAVKLPGEREQWKIFHHFIWNVNPGFCGTEAIQLWPAYRLAEGWCEAGAVTGRVLYTQDGQTYAAPYHSLGTETYAAVGPFGALFGNQTSTDVFATFSMPNSGERHRGYVSYSIAELNDGYIVDAWINYTHQQTLLQYPALTAKQQRMASTWDDGAFHTAQDALQFYPSDDGTQLIN
ncbi:hypothetical protein [Feifania hominis]|uniref:Uncharacterized protein n=1 Tax=Feifania hominis TaxID=2763660 RepID=A0A926DE59_9FIRM|nr:hypothetical protein [Feifania hominis]MBC8536187.1 hypothetical protein [Feifania hominis]